MGTSLEVRAAGVVRGGETLVSGVDFALDPGEGAAVTGPNGSGKTTLLSLVAGRERPTSGQVRVGGRPAEERRPGFRRAVAALIGVPPMARELTVAENLRMVEATWGEPGPLGDARDTLGALGLTALRNRFPHELSSGEGQAFALGMVLARPAELIVLDEPERRLDDARLATVVGVLRALTGAGASVVAATHEPAVVEALPHHHLWLQGNT